MNLKYEIGQTVEVEHTENIVSTLTKRERATINSITVGKDGVAKYLTSMGAFTETSLDAFRQPINIQPDTHPCTTQPIAPQEDKAKFVVGQKVKIVREGQKYPSYKEWFEISKIDRRIARRFNHGKTITNGDIVTVVASGTHERKSDGMLYAVETEDGGVYIIAEIGLEPYTESEQPKLIVTRDMLIKLNACSDGKNLFDRCFPDGSAPLEAVMLIAKTQGVSFGAEVWLNLRKSQIESMQNEQPKEPIVLYCVKEYHAGAWLTKGKTYVANKNSSGERYSLTFDDGWTDKTFSLERTTIGMGVVIGNYLIPLVKRPTKKDEIIFIEKCSSNKRFEGALCRVLRSDCGLPWVKTISGIYADTETAVSAEYLVLDNYTPEPEKEPEPVYYSGKIVCTESNENWWIAGKPYEVVDGVVFDEAKCARKCVLSVEDLNSTTLFTAKFIPYLGEA